MFDNDHIEDRDGRYYVRGSRVPISVLVHAWRTGSSPEIVHDKFPSVTLADVYASIAFYLEHREQVDEYMRADAAEFESARDAQFAANPERYLEWQRRYDRIRAHDAAS